MRPSWDSYFFEVAAVVAKRATCPRAAIGAVLTKNKRVIGTGYNGVPDGRRHCPSTPAHMALEHCEEAVHAEYNALANALVPAFGATLYVVGPRPVCPNCADRLRENGVTDIRHQVSVLTLDSVIREVNEWQAVTFPHESTPGKIAHLQEELRELWEQPENAEEMADVLMMMTDTARALGIDLIEEITKKLAVCRLRTWGEPDANGKIKAVKP